jgi:predicted enzyme related to lactoylglutathione lyase
MSRRERPWTPGTPCWADLSSPDLDTTLAFYGELLGWTYDIGGPEFGGYAIALRDGVPAAGVGPTMSAEQASAWTLHLATDDAGATAEAVASAGGTVHFPPMEVPGRGRMVLFTDPAGAFLGAWERGPFIGAGIVNEPGALSWEDLRSADPDASRAFLSAVFGFRHETLFDDPSGAYTTLGLDEPFPLGGVGPLWGAPASQWVVYFSVEDAAAAAETVTRLGGRVDRPVEDTPFGRLLSVTDPTGASLCLMQNTGQPQPDRA